MVTKKRGECVKFTAHHYYALWPDSSFSWQKHTDEVKPDERITKTSEGKILKIESLTPDDSALYTSTVVTKSLENKKITEITRHWLNITGMSAVALNFFLYFELELRLISWKMLK